ncbi:transcriptional regulator, GntR family [Arcobacter nitrofigilis DSM 7299]|uniref:Transcriptional regulator, GntR family n=1 Tax=Arcobacter nitrofigilis (strain ATCC 33309 / DSM 7299 / CCUG 15893 / LMG 7604 / NCTC 12251 / CI) TaxID=572480 RepID=D5V2W9_ARCNC|nr:GntR family transcriptional regulator [Arcobacter nitrofigilis]ADG92551.1 transcriptional regulator, GntR family [Arcobacter nitrofigilis DSM 7299]
MFAKNGIPLYIQLKKKLLKDIQDNYKPGDLLSPEVKLEKEYEVSRITIRKAIELLERDNVLERKQGSGTYIKEQKILYDANSIGSLTQRLNKQNHKLTTKSIEFEVIKKEHYVKELLKCDTLLCIKRFREMDGIPFALMLNYLDFDKVPNLKKKFNIESLYTFLKDEYNIEFFNAQETVEAKDSTKEEAQKLGIKEGSALLSLHRLSFDKDNNPVEYSDILIKANMYKHKITLSNDKISNY